MELNHKMNYYHVISAAIWFYSTSSKQIVNWWTDNENSQCYTVVNNLTKEEKPIVFTQREPQDQIQSDWTLLDIRSISTSKKRSNCEGQLAAWLI